MLLLKFLFSYLSSWTCDVRKAAGLIATVSMHDEDIQHLLCMHTASDGTDSALPHRLVFGGTQIWVFANPVEAKQSKKKYPTITYEYAQEEIASKNGIKMDNTANNGEH